MRSPWIFTTTRNTATARVGNHVLDLEMTIGGDQDPDQLQFIIAPQAAVQDIVRRMADGERPVTKPGRAAD